MDKYLSIITNFGCHYKCPYCIVKENNLHIPATTIGGLNKLDEVFTESGSDIISVSGGGDPLYEYEKHFDWYRELFKFSRMFNIKHHRCSDAAIPIEMHTSYMTDESSFPFYDCFRVVYHANTYSQLKQIKRTGNEKTRVVYVVTGNFRLVDIMDIAEYINKSDQIDELSFRQLVDCNYQPQHYLENYLKLGHKKLWHYIEQNDYNLYYCENSISFKYEDFKKLRSS
ncbi:MAG: hypothetical protein LUH21_04515 [Clostridiales bacterium]|nr:hypothetical protein [Clostridiales bacterium]